MISDAIETPGNKNGIIFVSSSSSNQTQMAIVTMLHQSTIMNSAEKTRVTMILLVNSCKNSDEKINSSWECSAQCQVELRSSVSV
mmetsp:Transcript_6195/g.11063  ORF Transcript_6195/g.11063 Transcript_6195/m.11063 type:complete len:85 (+) Transcript_6195:617-871(+)